MMRRTKILATFMLAMFVGLFVVGTVAAFPAGTSEVTAKGVARIRLQDGRVMPIRGVLTVDFAFNHRGAVWGMIMMEAADGNRADRIIWQFDPATDVTCTLTKQGLVTTINAVEVYCGYHNPDDLGSITVEYTHNKPIIRASGDDIEFVGNILSYA